MHDASTLNLYIINGGSGRILFNQYISDVNFDYPIDLVVDENGVFVTYYNQKVINMLNIIENNIFFPKNLMYEIWVIESFSTKMENSFTNMYVFFNIIYQIINYSHI